MKTLVLRLRSIKPRNLVAKAARVLARRAGAHRTRDSKRLANKSRGDLDALVRESGEW